MLGEMPSSPAPPGSIRPPVRPFYVWASILHLILGLGLAGLLVYDDVATHPSDAFDDPVGVFLQVQERDLAMADAVETAPGWQRALASVAGLTPVEIRRNAAEAFEKMVDRAGQEDAGWGASDVASLKAHHAVFLLETRDPKAPEYLASLRDDPLLRPFVNRVAPLYGLSSEDPGNEPRTPKTRGLQLKKGWALARLSARALDGHVSAEAVRIRAELEEEGRLALERLLRMFLLQLMVAVVGTALLVPLLRHSLPASLASTVVRGPWPRMLWGLEAFLRGMTLSLAPPLLWAVLLLGLSFTPVVLPVFPNWIYDLYMAGGYVLFVGLMVMVYRRHLPTGFFRSQGLVPGPEAWGYLLMATLCLTGLETTLTLLVNWTGQQFGHLPEWHEIFVEGLLSGSTAYKAVLFFSFLVMAPVCEEILFRGILYPALRVRLSPLPAAFLTALAFSAVHFYSVAGTLSLLLPAVLTSLFYERFRSLIPCILAHMFNNALVLWLILSVYS